jgi:hypothetical protein
VHQLSIGHVCLIGGKLYAEVYGVDGYVHVSIGIPPSIVGLISHILMSRVFGLPTTPIGRCLWACGGMTLPGIIAAKVLDRMQYMYERIG